MDLTSFHASLAEEEVIREDRAETEVDAEVEAGQEEQERIKTSTIAQTFFHDSSRGCATRDDEIEGDRAEVEARQMSRVDEASELKPPPSVSDRDDTHLCLILDSFTTQLIAWDLNEKDLLLFGQRILSFVEENSDENSFSEFQSFLLEDDSISRTQLVSTTSSLPNAPPVSFKSQTLSTILEESDYSLLNTLGRPWTEGNSIGSGITRVTHDLQFLDYDIIATCLVRAFVQLSLPTEYKHPRWKEIGDCLRYCLPRINQDSDALDNIWVHASPDMLRIISSMHLQLDGGGVKLSMKQRSRRDDNALLDNQTSTKDSTSKFQQSIQTLIEEKLNSNLPDSRPFITEHVLISVSVSVVPSCESSRNSSYEQIPLSFPVVLLGKKVVLQTFAAEYTSKSPHIPDAHLKIISRTTSEYNYGKYFLVDSDGIVKKDNITLEATCECNSGEFSLNRLFFLESCSQPSEYIQYALHEEVLCFTQGGSFDLRGPDLEKFITKDNEWIDAGIIGSFMDRISSAFVDHPRYQSNILLPLDFDVRVLVEDLTEEAAFLYLERVLGSYELDDKTIIHLVVNVKGEHWIYCSAVFSNSTIYLCDSLSKKLKKGAPIIDTNPVYNNLCKVLGMEFQRRRRTPLEWNKVICENLMQQSESPIRRCGVYCMVFLLRGFLEGIHCDLPFENFNLTDFNTFEDPAKTSFSNKFYSVLKEGILRVIVGSISVRDFVSFFANIHVKSKTEIFAKHKLVKDSNADFQCRSGWLPKGTHDFILNCI
jgi:hypothetical protein